MTALEGTYSSTVGQLAPDFMGSVSGPKDLSSSPTHMKGFGEWTHAVKPVDPKELQRPPRVAAISIQPQRCGHWFGPPPSATGRRCVAWSPCYHGFVIRSFKDRGTEDVYNGRNTREARGACPSSVWAVARRKLDQLDAAVLLEDLRVPPGNRLEALSGDRKGQHSIRVNDQYRICFSWTDEGPSDVEITDYH